MESKQNEIKNVDDYIAGFPDETRKMLNQIRLMITRAAPEAEEVISYQMPAYKYKGMLVYFAGYKNHIGFYPTASGIKKFKEEIIIYKNGKGSVQFPLNEPLPCELITKIVKFKIEENIIKEKNK